MKRKQLTHSKNYKKVLGEVRSNTPLSIVELIAKQLDRAEDAARRIEKEGLAVRDVRGAVVPHPAISVEVAATKTAADLIFKHKAVVRGR